MYLTSEEKNYYTFAIKYLDISAEAINLDMYYHAIVNTQKSEKFFKKIPGKIGILGIADAKDNRAIVYTDLGEYEKAEKLFKESMNLYFSNHFLVRKEIIGAGIISRNYAWLLRRKKNFKESLKKVRLSLRCYRVYGKEKYIIDSLIFIANLYLDLGRINRAKTIHSLCRKRKYKKSIFSFDLNILEARIEIEELKFKKVSNKKYKELERKLRFLSKYKCLAEKHKIAEHKIKLAQYCTNWKDFEKYLEEIAIIEEKIIDGENANSSIKYYGGKEYEHFAEIWEKMTFFNIKELHNLEKAFNCLEKCKCFRFLRVLGRSFALIPPKNIPTALIERENQIDEKMLDYTIDEEPSKWSEIPNLRKEKNEIYKEINKYGSCAKLYSKLRQGEIAKFKDLKKFLLNGHF